MSRQGKILDPKIRVFFSAVRASDYKQVKQFLRDKQLDRNVRDLEDAFQPTALLVAAEKQDVEMVRLLLHTKHRPPDPNLEDKRGKRAIWWAAFLGNEDLAEALLEDKKCEVNYIDKETGCSPLYRAIISNCTAVVRLIIHAGADINIRRLGYEVGSETPFIKAVQLDNYEVCELLINSMVNLQVKTDCGMTALHYAVAYGRHRIARLLLENCIKVNAKSNNGVTAMTVAIEHCDAAMVRLLLQFGYRPSRKYGWGETPLEQAIKLHAKGCALTLIRWGCRLDRRRNKKSYFSQAVEEKLTDVMRFLVSVRPIECFGERWIWQKKWPLSIYRRLDIIAWLEKESSTPRTLKNLCRAEIFLLLGENPSSKCEKLPLPSDLRDFLKFQEFTPEALYEEKSVDKLECPFDCKWTCQNLQCPKLDISSSSESEFEVE